MSEKVAPTEKQRKNQKKIAREFTRFRAKYLFTQGALAQALGISRRTVQYIERGNPARSEWLCMPKAETILRFGILKDKHERASDGREGIEQPSIGQGSDRGDCGLDPA